MTIAAWYWLVAGLCLIGLELLFPSFALLWFGIGALAIAVVSLLVAGVPAWVQVPLWIAVSWLFNRMWNSYLKPKAALRAPGEEALQALIGQEGSITRGRDGENYAKAMVAFDRRLCGAREWPCTADVPLEEGERVRVVTVQGHTLTVERLPEEH